VSDEQQAMIDELRELVLRQGEELRVLCARLDDRDAAPGTHAADDPVDIVDAADAAPVQTALSSRRRLLAIAGGAAAFAVGAAVSNAQPAAALGASITLGDTTTSPGGAVHATVIDYSTTSGPGDYFIVTDSAARPSVFNAVLTGYNNLGPNLVAILGRSTIAGGTGVSGTTNNANAFGVSGLATGANGTGLSGSATGGSGIGVQGSSTAAGGTGVFGVAGADSSTAVFGKSTGTNSTGVLGTSTSPSSPGVSGSAAGTNADGVVGAATGLNGDGVAGSAAGDNGIGVIGSTTNVTGYALYAGGTGRIGFAQTLPAGPPATGTFALRDIIGDAAGNLFVNVVAGTPGTFRKLAGPATAGAFHPISPTRVYDSRTPAPSPGALAAGSTRTISVADGRDITSGAVNTAGVVPAGATAVSCNVTVVNTVNAGFLAVNPGGNTVIAASTINWSSSGQILANGIIAALGGDRTLTVIAGAGASDFAVDITGYFQ